MALPEGVPLWRLPAWAEQDPAPVASSRTVLGLGALAVLSAISTAFIDANAVTYDKIQEVSAASRVLGRGTSGAGDVEELTVSSGLSLTGTALALNQGFAPTWTATHGFTTTGAGGGIAIGGNAGVPVSVSVNPWFIADSKSSQTIYATGASATMPETALQLFMTNALGWGSSPEAFKVTFFAANSALPGAASSYAINGVLDIAASVNGINGIVGEFDLNIRNQHYGDAAGAPSFPYATAVYIASGGDKRATAAIMVNCVNAAAGDLAFNRGIVFFGGDVRLNTYEDWTDSAGGIVIGGNKTNAIDLTNATCSNKQINGFGFSFDPVGNLALGNVTAGAWNGTVIAGLYGGTGVANSGKTITLGGNLTTSGAHATTFTTTGTTGVTLPTAGTLATLAGTEAFTNKTLTSPTINGGTHTAITSLGIRSTGSGAFDLTLANSENLSAGRTLTFTLNDAARTINLAGNFTTSGANALTLTTTGGTNVTLPTSGTLVNSGVTTLSSLASIGTITTGTWNAGAVTVNDAVLKVQKSGATIAQFRLDNSTRDWTLSAYGTDFSPNGALAIADETAGAVRLYIDSNGNFGFNGIDMQGTTKGIFIANASAGPSGNPTGGGILYVSAGGLVWRGSSGTVTPLANA